MAQGPTELVRPCTWEDLVANVDAQNALNTTIIDLLQTGGGGDTFKVAVDLANLATPNYLNDQLLYVPADGLLDTYPAMAVPVVADVDSNLERLRCDFSQVTGLGGDPEADFVLRLSGGNLMWENYSTFSNSFTVKASNLDLTDEFLNASFQVNAAYVSGADLVVATEVVGSPGTNQKVRPFVDVSTIDGWHASDLKILGIEGNVSHYFDVEDVVASSVYHLVRGQVVGNVAANATTFSIDNLASLAYGRDPRSNPSSPSETLTVYNSLQEAYRNDTWITAIYQQVANRWETLVVERFRAIRGQYVSGTDTLTIDHIVALDGGVDPRTNPTSASETVSVTRLVSTDTFSSGDNVWADWNAKDGVWEARKLGGVSTNLTYGKTTSAIGAATGWALADAGTGTFQRLGLDGLADGPEITVKSRYFDPLPSGIPVYVNDDDIIINAGCRTGPSS